MSEKETICRHLTTDISQQTSRSRQEEVEGEIHKDGLRMDCCTPVIYSVKVTKPRVHNWKCMMCHSNWWVLITLWYCCTMSWLDVMSLAVGTTSTHECTYGGRMMEPE